MPNPSSYFLGSSIVQKPAPASVPSTTPPVFAGIVSATPDNDGSIVASWAAGTAANPPISYQVYIAFGSVSAGVLFNASNLTEIVPSGVLSARIFTLKDQQTYLLKDQVYTLGVRAVDAYGNTETNIAISTAISTGVDVTPIYEPRAVFSINAANELQGSIWIVRDSQKLSSNLGLASYSIRNKAGTLIGISQSNISADGNGIFQITPVLASAITDLNHYTVDISIVADGSPRVGVVAIVVGE